MTKTSSTFSGISDEFKEDKIREAANEFDDGALEQFIASDLISLMTAFCEGNDEFYDYCKEVFNDHK